LLIAEETAALVAAPTPLAFWRTKRGKAKGDVTFYGSLARCLELSIERPGAGVQRRDR
jgi:hypothetical protein